MNRTCGAVDCDSAKELHYVYGDFTSAGIARSVGFLLCEKHEKQVRGGDFSCLPSPAAKPESKKRTPKKGKAQE